MPMHRAFKKLIVWYALFARAHEVVRPFVTDVPVFPSADIVDLVPMITMPFFVVFVSIIFLVVIAIIGGYIRIFKITALAGSLRRDLGIS